MATVSGNNGTAFVTTDTHSLQGWLKSHSAKRGTQALYTESLAYDSPASSIGSIALYTGMISARSDQWKFTNYGQGVTTTEGYLYDNGGRLSAIIKSGLTKNYYYDARGNLTQAGTDSYSYNGDKLSSFTRVGQSAVYFTHDSRGRMTYDGASGVTIDYNYLNLTRKISGTGGTLVKYSYLANGSKTGAENGSGAGLVYRGSLIYKKASNGTLTFEGASIPEGRLLSGATRLYVTDHLGSVKAVVNGNNGNLYEVNNYTVYGKRSANSSASNYISTVPSGEKFRQHFTGKEDQAPDFTVPFTDFGARQYSPALRRWLVPDPLSEKYYGISPYAYCAGDPVNLVDPDGMDIWGLKVSGEIINMESNDDLHEIRVLDQDGKMTEKSFSMEDDSVFDALKGSLGKASYIGEAKESSKLLSLFFFLSDNSSVEWALHKNSSQVVLGTVRENDNAGNWGLLGMIERPVFSIHSHPNINATRYDEFFSLGMIPVDQNYNSFNPIIGYDWNMVQTKHDLIAKNYLVYFPVSGNFYRLGYPNKVSMKKNLFEEYR